MKMVVICGGCLPRLFSDNDGDGIPDYADPCELPNTIDDGAGTGVDLTTV